MAEYIERITSNFIENEEEFIYQFIIPYCEDVLETKINKSELQKILIKGSNPNLIEREKIDKAIEEIKDGYYGNEEASETSTERAEAFNNGLTYALEILKKHIEGSEE